MTYFSELGLAEPILRALGAKGYSDPTPIQREAIPALLEGRDLLGIAQTGTGKTAAFSLPSLHRLAAEPKGRLNAACRMLVLSPTRELAAQIAENMRGYAKYLNLSVQCIFGGVPVGKQARALTGGCDILVATPGRLLDLIDQRALTLRHVEIFVLDEADQMMDLGFIKPLTRVAAMLPEQRQSLFFSATMPQAIAELGKRFIKNPVKVEVAPQATTAERVEQYVTFIDQKEKQALLTLKLRAGLADKSIDRALVFTRTKHGADRVVRHLVTAGITAAAIHGNKSQAQRTAALGGFRTGHTPVLVATDIAARGIDVSGVSHVFNFEMPNVSEQYVHRIGRTARAGADGIALSFVAGDEKSYLRDIEKLTGVRLDVLQLPEDFQKEAARLPLPSRKPAEAAQDARRDERDQRGRFGNRGGGRSGSAQSDNRRNERGPRRDGGERRDQRGPVFNPLGERNERHGGEVRRERPQGERSQQGERREFRNDDRGERRPDQRNERGGERRPNRERSHEQRGERADRRPEHRAENRGERWPDQRPEHRGERRPQEHRSGEQRSGTDNRNHSNPGAKPKGKFRSKQPWKSDAAARGVTAPHSGRAQVHRKG